MKVLKVCVAALAAFVALSAIAGQKQPAKVIRTNAEWKKILSADAYRILREAGTEQAYTGKYWNNHEKGVYYCAGCGQKLFTSDTKFNSNTGWPSFWKPANNKAIIERADNSLGERRTEVRCSRCEGHLGHVFKDGPKPTGLRYCINSAALTFKKTK